MDLDIENVRAAWDWALKRGQIALLDRLLSALWRYADCRDRRHYGAWFCETVQVLSPTVAQKTAEALVRPNESGESRLAKTSEPRLRLLAKLLAAQAGCGDIHRDQIPLLRQSLSILERLERHGRDLPFKYPVQIPLIVRHMLKMPNQHME